MNQAVAAKHNLGMPVVSGAAERGANIPTGAAPEKGRPIALRVPNSLKDMSMSEIIELAEKRTKIDGTNRRLTDNPWCKRMTVSDNVTRDQTPSYTLMINQQSELDSNEEFFDNLLQKMIKEQFFAPDSRANRKRTCLWNKENYNGSDRVKRQMKNTINSKLIPPKMDMFTKRLLPQMNNDNFLAGNKIQSQYMANDKKDQGRCDRRYKTILDVIQEDRITNEVNSRFKQFHPSMVTLTTENNGSFHLNATADESFPASTQETLKLEYNRPENEINFDPIHEVFPRQYYVGKFPKKVWDSPPLPTIDEYQQLSTIVESPIFTAVNMDSNMSVQLTPPLMRESSDCKACDMEKYDNNVNNNYNQLLFPTISFESDCQLLGMLDKSLFT